jgi:hypothetical protein
MAALQPISKEWNLENQFGPTCTAQTSGVMSNAAQLHAVSQRPNLAYGDSWNHATRKKVGAA